MSAQDAANGYFALKTNIANLGADGLCSNKLLNPKMWFTKKTEASDSKDMKSYAAGASLI